MVKKKLTLLEFVKYYHENFEPQPYQIELLKKLDDMKDKKIRFVNPLCKKNKREWVTELQSDKPTKIIGFGSMSRISYTIMDDPMAGVSI